MKANWRRLSTRSLGAAIKRMINVTNLNANAEAKQHPVFVRLTDAYAVFAPLVPKSAFSGMYKTVCQLGMEVYNYLQGIRKVAEGAAQFTDTEKGQAGAKIAALIKKGGKIYRQTMGEADFSTTTIIEELNKPENAPYIETLGLASEVQTLTEAKARYEQQDMERVDIDSSLRQTDSATVARVEMENNLKDWLNLVTAMRKVEGWEDLYADLNEVVKSAKRAIREGRELTEDGDLSDVGNLPAEEGG